MKEEAFDLTGTRRGTCEGLEERKGKDVIILKLKQKKNFRTK